MSARHNMKRLLPSLAISILTMAAAGCDADPDNPPAERLRFEECPKALSGETANRTCATSTVPLRHSDPSGSRIDLLVARYAAQNQSKGQLWMLDGGPGGTGVNYMHELVLPYYRQLGYDIYIPQHRGTGHSSPLSCAMPNEPAACGAEVVEKWGDDLTGYSSVEAGHDVGVLIERAREEGTKVFVFGLSYGSYWAQRYLQAYPTQADGVLMDGILPLDQGLWNSDSLTNEAGLRLLSACAADEACKAALGGDPVATAHRVIERARDAATRCEGAEGFDRDDLSTILSGAMVMELGNAVPALLLRLDRCTAEDVQQLGAFRRTLMEILSSMNVEDWEASNPALGQHVLRTDLMAEVTSLPLEQLIPKRDEMLVWSGAISLEATQQLLTSWPVNYPPIDKVVSAAKVPVLISNGGFDLQTPLPWANDFADANGVEAWIFPYAGHGVDISLAVGTGEQLPCSLAMKAQFLENPRGKIDGSCIARLPPPDFRATSATAKNVSMALFGTPELLPGFAVAGVDAIGGGAKLNAGANANLQLVLAKQVRKQPRILEALRRSLGGRTQP